jgi:hypothetical protein
MYVWTMYTDPTPAEVARYADIQGSSFRIGLTNVIYAYNVSVTTNQPWLFLGSLKVHVL